MHVSKPCTKLTLHCNHRSGHLKTEHIERLFLLRRHLGNWPPPPHSKHEKRTAGSAWETWTIAAADGVRCARVRWEINFQLTSETAPFFCVYPVYILICTHTFQPTSVTAQSNVWVCSRSLVRIAGLNPAWNTEAFLFWVLSGGGLCVGLITHPEESYRVWWWSLTH